MRRSISVLSALIFSVVAIGLQAQGGGDLATRLGRPDFVFVNGKIVTVDDESFSATPGTVAQALAVRGDKILAVGTTAEITALAGPTTKTIDLKGRTMLPTFTLTHEHPTDWAWSHPEALKHVMGASDTFGGAMMRFLDGSASAQLAAWEPTLKDMVSKAKPGQWLWLSTKLGANFENAEELFAKFLAEVTVAKIDAIAPNNPVRVKNGWPLMNVENTKAIEDAKRQHPDQDLNSGEFGDRLFEPDVIMTGHTEELAQLLKAEMELWVAHGVTAFGSSPYNLHNLQALALLDRRGEMPARFAWGYTGPDFHEETLRFVATLLGQGSPYLWNIGAWSGAGGNCTTIDAAPAVKAKENCNFAPGTPAREVAERIVRTGGRIATMHSYADKDIDYLLDAIEKGSKDAGFTLEQIRAKHHAFDHAMGAPRADQLPRIKNLGMTISMINTAIWENRTSYDASFRAKDYGMEYVKWSVPRKSVTAAGIMNSQEIDRPLPHKIFYNLWAGMTRYNEGRQQVMAASEGTDRITQLKAVTTWGAHYMLREKTMGSLEAGKLADLIVLDSDYLTVAVNDIPKIKVLLTMVGGKIAHLRPELGTEIGMQPVGPITWPTQPMQRYFVVPPVNAPTGQ